MYGLTNEELLLVVIEKSEKLGITAYEFGDKTDLSSVGAHNILTRESKNPRRKNLVMMLQYLESVQLKKNYKEESPVLQIAKEPEAEDVSNLEEIIFERMYAKLEPELTAMNQKLTSMRMDLKTLHDNQILLKKQIRESENKSRQSS